MAMRKSLAVIERALLQLPERCRYHGDQIDRGGESWTRRPCCDTGFPALLRREALQDLRDLDARPPLDRMTGQQCPAGVHPDWAVESADGHACPWCEADRLRADLTGMSELHDVAIAGCTNAAKQRDEARAELAQVAEMAARDCARERERAGRCERDMVAAQDKVRAVEQVRVWRNEDGKGFLFADDVRTALGCPTKAAVPAGGEPQP